MDFQLTPGIIFRCIKFSFSCLSCIYLKGIVRWRQPRDGVREKLCSNIQHICFFWIACWNILIWKISSIFDLKDFFKLIFYVSHSNERKFPLFEYIANVFPFFSHLSKSAFNIRSRLLDSRTSKIIWGIHALCIIFERFPLIYVWKISLYWYCCHKVPGKVSPTTKQHLFQSCITGAEKQLIIAQNIWFCSWWESKSKLPL